MNNIKFNLKKIFQNEFSESLIHSLIFMSIYITTFFIYRDFGIRISIGYSVLLILAILIILKHYALKETFELTNVHFAYLFFVFMTLLNFIRPSSNHDKDNLAYIFLMVMTVVFLLYSKIKLNNIKPMMVIFSFAATAFSLFIIFFQFFKQLYWQLIYPFLSNTAKIYADRFYFNGYSVSLGGFTYTDYLLVFGLVSVFSFLLFHSIKPAKKIGLYLMLSLIFITIILVGRRGELIALIISLGVFYISTAKKGMLLKRLGILLSLLIVFAGIVVLTLPFLSEVSFLHRYTVTLNALFNGHKLPGGVTSGRIELYRDAWNLFLKRPIFGNGWGSFVEYRVQILGQTDQIRDVHNIILQLLAETGIIGLILILSPIIYIYKETISQTTRLWQNKNIDQIDPQIYSANTISLLFQTFIFTLALVDPSNYKIIFWPFYFVVVYLHLCTVKERDENSIWMYFKKAMQRKKQVI